MQQYQECSARSALISTKWVASSDPGSVLRLSSRELVTFFLFCYARRVPRHAAARNSSQAKLYKRLSIDTWQYHVSMLAFG